MLERRAGLDALACLVIMLRQAIGKDDSVFAQSLSWRVCRMLLVLGPTLSAMGIGTPLIQYFEQELLPLATMDGRHYQFWDQGYQSAARRLNAVASLVEADENRLFTDAERVALRFDLLDGNRGDVLCDPVALMSPHVLSTRDTPIRCCAKSTSLNTLKGLP